MTDNYDETERRGEYDTPRPLDNRQGLDGLHYRVGDFGSFRRTMFRKIPSVQVEVEVEDDSGRKIVQAAPLRNWSARDSDDYGIALIELWAYVADILTFYQERIANEAFIRTARHRESLVRLAKLLEYKPAPGVAASVYLVFQMADGSSARIRRQFPVQHVPQGKEKPQTFETSEELNASAVWNELTVLPDQPCNVSFNIDDTAVRLQGANARITVGDWVLIMGRKRGNAMPYSKDAGSEGYEVRQIVEVERLQEKDETCIVFDEPLGTRIWGHKIVVEAEADLYVFRGSGALFGHNAPDWRTLGAFAAFEYLSKSQQDKVSSSSDSVTYLRAVADAVRQQGDFPNQELALGKGKLDLDRVYKKVVRDGWLALINAGYREAYKVIDVESVSRTDYTRSAQVSRVKVDTEENFDNYGLAKKAPFKRVRGTVVLLDAEQMALARDVIPTLVSGTEIAVVEDVSLLEQGHLLMVVGETVSDGLQGEVAVVKETRSAPDNRIILLEGLRYDYIRSSVRLFANVVAATNGETIAEEILGNGDAAIPFQRFELKQSPLTYIPQAGAPNGAAPALEFRVNNILWKNVRSFYGQGNSETIYTIDITDEQGTILRTGDSRTGARPGTGRNNVSVTYRKGLGRTGNVPENTIKTMLERPKGVKKTFNPLAASGGADPETNASIRANAPNTVRTFGRIVSLRDFEDAAREFTGISKALALLEWDEEWQVVKLIIAGGDGAKVVGEPLKTFTADLNSRRDPNRKLVVENYQPAEVALTIEIYPDPAFLPEGLPASVTAAIERFFAFDNLSLGQRISLSEMYQVVHSVDGVAGAHISRFYIVDDPEAVSVENVLQVGRNQLASLNTGSRSTYIIDIAGEV